jgi:hypothetical protein
MRSDTGPIPIKHRGILAKRVSIQPLILNDAKYLSTSLLEIETLNHRRVSEITSRYRAETPKILDCVAP